MLRTGRNHITHVPNLQVSTEHLPRHAASKDTYLPGALRVRPPHARPAGASVAAALLPSPQLAARERHAGGCHSCGQHGGSKTAPAERQEEGQGAEGQHPQGCCYCSQDRSAPAASTSTPRRPHQGGCLCKDVQEGAWRVLRLQAMETFREEDAVHSAAHGRHVWEAAWRAVRLRAAGASRWELDMHLGCRLHMRSSGNEPHLPDWVCARIGQQDVRHPAGSSGHTAGMAVFAGHSVCLKALTCQVAEHGQI